MTETIFIKNMKELEKVHKKYKMDNNLLLEYQRGSFTVPTFLSIFEGKFDGHQPLISQNQRLSDEELESYGFDIKQARADYPEYFL